MTLTANSITDDQIRELAAEILGDPSWAGGGRARTVMLKFCEKALESGIYRGARERVTEAFNARPIMVECPRCLVAAGVRCTSLARSGYAPIKCSHPERAQRAERIALASTRTTKKRDHE